MGFLQVKDVMEICGCGYRTALELRIDVASSFGIRPNLVTYEHLRRYLKLD